jgi:hypothetical protein
VVSVNCVSNDRAGDQKAHNLLVNGVQHGPPIKILTKIYVTKVFNHWRHYRIRHRNASQKQVPF